PVVIAPDAQVVESDLAARNLLPGAPALAGRANRRQRLDLQLGVDIAPRQVVDDRHLPAARRQMQRRRPPAEAVASENQNPHHPSLSFSATPCATVPSPGPRTISASAANARPPSRESGRGGGLFSLNLERPAACTVGPALWRAGRRLILKAEESMGER